MYVWSAEVTNKDDDMSAMLEKRFPRAEKMDVEYKNLSA